MQLYRVGARETWPLESHQLFSLLAWNYTLSALFASVITVVAALIAYELIKDNVSQVRSSLISLSGNKRISHHSLSSMATLKGFPMSMVMLSIVGLAIFSAVTPRCAFVAVMAASLMLVLQQISGAEMFVNRSLTHSSLMSMFSRPFTSIPKVSGGRLAVGLYSTMLLVSMVVFGLSLAEVVVNSSIHSIGYMSQSMLWRWLLALELGLIFSFASICVSNLCLRNIETRFMMVEGDHEHRNSMWTSIVLQTVFGKVKPYVDPTVLNEFSEAVVISFLFAPKSEIMFDSVRLLLSVMYSLMNEFQLCEMRVL
eukprot:GHVH01005006.1.p1 GENE.GHVH01005006.1~~GHVH01005006.1.p1  ORF type:complete len:311 (+),score=32.02 GHVH01005006.1:174-1106(+)